MTRIAPWFAVAGLLAARTSFASNVSDELTYGQARLDSDTARSRFYGNKLSGLLDIGEHLSLHLGAAATHYEPTPSVSSETVYQLFGGGHWDTGDHWAFGLGGMFSPASTVTSWIDTTATSSAGTVAATAETESRTTSYGFDVTGEYDTVADDDTAEERPSETVAALTLGAVSYLVHEETLHLRSQTGQELPLQTASTSCRGRGCGAGNGGDGSTSIWQFRVSAGITETLYETTDLDLFATYYLYTTDLAKMGRSTSGAVNRSTSTEGIPMQPLRFSVRPSIVKRIGPVGIEPSFQYAEYAEEDGYNLTGGLRVHYRFSKSLKLWVGGSLSSSIEPAGSTLTAWASLGARMRF